MEQKLRHIFQDFALWECEHCPMITKPGAKYHLLDLTAQMCTLSTGSGSEVNIHDIGRMCSFYRARSWCFKAGCFGVTVLIRMSEIISFSAEQSYISQAVLKVGMRCDFHSWSVDFSSPNGAAPLKMPHTQVRMPISRSYSQSHLHLMKNSHQRELTFLVLFKGASNVGTSNIRRLPIMSRIHIIAPSRNRAQTLRKSPAVTSTILCKIVDNVVSCAFATNEERVSSACCDTLGLASDRDTDDWAGGTVEVRAGECLERSAIVVGFESGVEDWAGRCWFGDFGMGETGVGGRLFTEGLVRLERSME